MGLKTETFDAAAVLDTSEAIEAYLADAFESEDPTMISHAIGVVARAKGMTRMAAETGFSRQALYKALSPEGRPEFATIVMALRALGYRLSAQARSL